MVVAKRLARSFGSIHEPIVPFLEGRIGRKGSVIATGIEVDFNILDPAKDRLERSGERSSTVREGRFVWQKD